MISKISIRTRVGWISVFEKEGKIFKIIFGKLKNQLGDCLFVSMDGNLDDSKYFKKQLQLVVDQLKERGVTPSQFRRKCEDCILMCKSGEKKSFYTDGDYCTYCSSILLKTTDVKDYCSKCNQHAN